MMWNTLKSVSHNFIMFKVKIDFVGFIKGSSIISAFSQEDREYTRVRG